MWFQRPTQNANNTNVKIYPMEQGDLFTNNDKNFNLIVINKKTNTIINRSSAGQDSSLKYYQSFTIPYQIPIQLNGSMDSYSPIQEILGIADITTIYLNFKDNPSQQPYLRVSVENTNNWITANSVDMYFDGNGETKDVHVQSNDDWIVE